MEIKKKNLVWFCNRTVICLYKLWCFTYRSNLLSFQTLLSNIRKVMILTNPKKYSFKRRVDFVYTHITQLTNYKWFFVVTYHPTLHPSLLLKILFQCIDRLLSVMPETNQCGYKIFSSFGLHPLTDIQCCRCQADSNWYKAEICILHGNTRNGRCPILLFWD